MKALQTQANKHVALTFSSILLASTRHRPGTAMAQKDQLLAVGLSSIVEEAAPEEVISDQMEVDDGGFDSEEEPIVYDDVGVIYPSGYVTCNGRPALPPALTYQYTPAGVPATSATGFNLSRASGGCLDFDPRRADGNQVLLFSCGGRADGADLGYRELPGASWQVEPATNSRLFTFSSATAPINQADTFACLFDTLDTQACDVAKPSATQFFTMYRVKPLEPERQCTVHHVVPEGW
ncbi:hypothetical protein B0H10DRAFT_2249495 [Mycena sp. CBHHK59/15]|nr:hypothetical protein B0H10DRAFT_2249495 [Mycena sp. CBHHK59/15]